MAIQGPPEVVGSDFSYKYSQTPHFVKKKDLGEFFRQILTLFLSNFSPKHFLTPLILLFSQNHKVMFLYSIFLSLVPYL